MTAMTTRAEFKVQSQSALDGAFHHTEHDGRVYDVFFWVEDGQQQFATAPWATASHRAHPVKKLANGAWVNAKELPNGIPAEAAIFAGSVYRGDPPSEK